MAAIDEIDITSLLFQEGSAPSTPASTKWRAYFKTTGLFVMDDAGAEYGPLAAAGAATFTTEDGQVTTDVSLSAATYTDIVSVSLAAGTWDIWAWLTLRGPASTTADSDVYAEIVNASNTRFAQTKGVNSRATNSIPNRAVTLSVFAGAVVLGSTTTMKLRGYSELANVAFGSTSLGTGGGSKIHAMKIA